MFAEVTVNRMTDQIMDELIKDATNDLTNVVKHKYNGNLTMLNSIDLSKDTTSNLLAHELSNFVQEFKIIPQTSTNSNQNGDDIEISRKLKTKIKKKRSPAIQKRENMRRARNKNGILLSSLKKKIYHCNCIDCQAKRVKDGKPAYLGKFLNQN